MVNPIYIVAVLLGVAFTSGFFSKKGKNIAGYLSMLALGFVSFVSLQWLHGFLSEQQAAAQIFTTAFKPPFSINLLMGKEEAIFTSLINIMGLIGGLYLFRKLKETGSNAFIALLLLIMGLNVIVMTRDLFNLFVFMEISSIAVAGLIILSQNVKSISSGFKYMLAGGLISGMLLLGTIFLYYFTGTLNIDGMLQQDLNLVKGSSVAVFLVITAIVLELKPFPANGWGVDVYEGADAGISALISSAYATASVYVFMKLIPIASEQFQFLIAAIGIITFVASNLMGLRQNNPNRLLGYSSISQIGLLMAIIGLSSVIGESTNFIVISILVSHYFAKAGLFWISGIIKTNSIRDWSVLRHNKLLLVSFGIFIFALVGLPPFPSFFGKWELIMNLSGSHNFIWVAAILIGSFLEAVYMFRWLGYAIKLELPSEIKPVIKLNKIIPVILFAASVMTAGYFTGMNHEYGKLINYIPLAFALAFVLIEFLPVFIKNTLAIAGLALYFYLNYQSYTDISRIFAAIFLLGGILTLLAGYAYKGKRLGFFPFALMMFAGLIGLIEAKSTLEFFYAWELMTIGSYFLIIRGKKSITHALSYMLFSIGGAYLIMAGLGIASIGKAYLTLSILHQVTEYAPLVFILLAVGFMTKTASIGLHIWLPGAHAEAEADVSPMVSAILLKAGVFGLLILLIAMGEQFIGKVSIPYLLSWVGALTALMGNMMAAFQEDAKKLLAYSSIGALGYAVFGLSLMSHLGWLTAISFSITHFMLKALLFLAIGGVVWRLKTKDMYKMGGLIKKMPFSFLSVLIGIIVLAGVPPLTGFSGKWLFYQAVMEKQWFLQGTVLFFSGIIAFLYCFRLIHAIFLGQLKDEHRNVKEAPFWILVPQYILLAVLLGFSFLPGSMLKPIGNMLVPFFPDGAIHWDGQLATTVYGYWNGKTVMIIIIGIFSVVFGWLWFMNRKARKIKQFNIVYAAERPFRPETTHFAYNFFAPYKKAIGFLVAPGITNFWNRIDEGAHAVSDKFTKLYNGNGQTYLIHIVAFIVVIYLISFGGF